MYLDNPQIFALNSTDYMLYKCLIFLWQCWPVVGKSQFWDPLWPHIFHALTFGGQSGYRIICGHEIVWNIYLLACLDRTWRYGMNLIKQGESVTVSKRSQNRAAVWLHIFLAPLTSGGQCSYRTMSVSMKQVSHPAWIGDSGQISLSRVELRQCQKSWIVV